MITLDTVLKKGQTVEVVRTVTYKYKVAISEYLDEWDNDTITVEEFQEDQADNIDIDDISVVEVISDEVKVKAIS